MFPAARKGDPITHDMLAPAGLIAPPVAGPCPGVGIVMIESLPAAHVLCSVACTGATSAGPAHPPPPVPPPIVLGSPTVHIHSQFASRWAPSGDIGGCGVFLGDPKLAATRTVLIGGPAGSASMAGGTMTVTLGGMVVNGTPDDIAAWMTILAQDMDRSPAFTNTTLGVIGDTAHPVTVNLGRGQTDTIIDNFGNNNVDLNDLGQLSTTPRAGHPNESTRGEMVAHFLAERHDAAVTGNPDFDPAHAAGVTAQNQVRAENGQSPVTTQEFAGNDAAGNSIGRTNYADGTHQDAIIDGNNNVIGVIPP